MRIPAKRFEELVVWQKAHQFVLEIYLILANDLEYGDVSNLNLLIEEVSKLLEAYSHAILNSDS